MADVFISYAREEAARADEVRRALEGLGLSVFFDVERLDAGDEWSDVLDRELKSSGAVVALWSPHALSRPWVRKECALAQARGVLLPALIEPVSDLDMPVQFAGLQRVDLSDFHGASDHPGWRKLVRALAKTLKRPDLLAAQVAALKEEKQTAKVKAELEAAQDELAKLRKSKGGVKPVFVAAGLVLLLGLGGAGAWWGFGEMQRQTAEAVDKTRKSIVDPDLMKALSAIPEEQMANGDYEALLESALQKTKLERLIEASPVDADAALLAGRVYNYGLREVPRDNAEAAVHFRRSCDLGNLLGCQHLGAKYAEGEGVATDHAAALSLFERACTGGVAEACSDIGIMYERGLGVAKDETKAASLHQQACDGGSLHACVNLGGSYRDGQGVAEDKSKAAALYSKACDGGEMAGCYGLGFLYADGQGVPHDNAKAVSLYTRACDGKYFQACNSLAQHYEMGAGVTKDDAKALSLLELACDDRMALACFNVGTMVELGRGAAKDQARANAAFAKWASIFEADCDAGEGMSCLELGEMLEEGLKIAKDPVKASTAYAKAVSLFEGDCNRGEASQCWNFGQMFEDGLGVATDSAKALAAFAKACKLGEQPACLKLPPEAPAPP